MNEITLEDLARHCGYAEYYLSRKFAKETGMKISDLLRFGNRSHFDRVFRQHVGVSPAKFREQGGQLSDHKETT